MLIEEITGLYQKVIILCRLYNCSTTSGYRTKKRNTEVEGHKESLHMRGLAIDIVPDEWGIVARLSQALKRLDLHFLVESDHIHVQTRPALKLNTSTVSETEGTVL